jgi:hypothetical protein
MAAQELDRGDAVSAIIAGAFGPERGGAVSRKS